jgi:hypothetical protein
VGGERWYSVVPSWAKRVPCTLVPPATRGTKICISFGAEVRALYERSLPRETIALPSGTIARLGLEARKTSQTVIAEPTRNFAVLLCSLATVDDVVFAAWLVRALGPCLEEASCSCSVLRWGLQGPSEW